MSLREILLALLLLICCVAAIVVECFQLGRLTDVLLLRSGEGAQAEAPILSTTQAEAYEIEIDTLKRMLDEQLSMRWQCEQENERLLAGCGAEAQQDCINQSTSGTNSPAVVSEGDITIP